MKNQDKDTLSKYADIIEKTLDSFGIRSQVAEINDEKDSYVFYMNIVRGTPIEDIEKRSRDLALALAAPDGNVKIIAPIPGRSLIGIAVKKSGKDTQGKSEKYKIIRITEKEYVTFDYIQTVRQRCATILFIIAYLIGKIGDVVDTKYTLEELPQNTPKKDDKTVTDKKVEEATVEHKSVRYWLVLLFAFFLGMLTITLFYMMLTVE